MIDIGSVVICHNFWSVGDAQAVVLKHLFKTKTGAWGEPGNYYFVLAPSATGKAALQYISAEKAEICGDLGLVLKTRKWFEEWQSGDRKFARPLNIGLSLKTIGKMIRNNMATPDQLIMSQATFKNLQTHYNPKKKSIDVSMQVKLATPIKHIKFEGII